MTGLLFKLTCILQPYCNWQVTSIFAPKELLSEFSARIPASFVSRHFCFFLAVNTLLIPLSYCRSHSSLCVLRRLAKREYLYLLLDVSGKVLIVIKFTMLIMNTFVVLYQTEDVCCSLLRLFLFSMILNITVNIEFCQMLYFCTLMHSYDFLTLSFACDRLI